MPGSFQSVEDKLLEAEYFLIKLQTTNAHNVESRYYFSAFVSASRSVTLSLQKSMKGVTNFKEWYEDASIVLIRSYTSKYFVKVRNSIVHEGDNPLNQITLSHLRESLRLQLLEKDYSNKILFPDSRSELNSALTSATQKCYEYFIEILELVYECYKEFKHYVDPKWYYTEDNFAKNGKGLVEALNELGYPSSWALAFPDEVNAWAVIRSMQTPTAANELFSKYLCKVVPCPDSEFE